MIKKIRMILLLILIICMIFSLGTASAGTVYSKWLDKNYTTNSSFDNSIVVQGLDIYAGQNTCDFEKMKADGVDFVIIRIGFRGYGTAGNMQEDKRFYENYLKAKEAGMVIGTYFFSQCHSEKEAREEVDLCDEIMKKYGLSSSDFELPLFMDFEYSPVSSGRLVSGKYSKSTLTKTALAWMDEAEILGYKSGIYANYNFFKKAIDGEMLSETYPLWVAQYNSWCDSQYKYSFWQYSSSASVNGVGSKRCDANFWYLDKEPEIRGIDSIADANISLTNQGKYTYEGGKKNEPTVKVSLNGRTLEKDTDYKVKYIKNIEAGTAYALVIGTGQYSDYAAVDFEIKPDTTLNGISISETSDKEYDGTSHIPNIKVTDAKGKTLKKDYDYSLDIDGDTVNVGTVKVNINFIRNYQGVKTISYDILKAQQEIEGIDDRTELITSDEPYNLGVTLKFPEGKVTYESSDEDVLTVSEDGTVTPVSKGNATITVTAKGNSNYKKQVREIDITVAPSKEELLIEGVNKTTLTMKSELTEKGIKLKWTKSKGYKVDYYEVYRSTKKSSGYGTVPIYTTSNGSKYNYTNTKGLKEGTRYYYKVKGVREVNGEKYYTQWSTKANRTWKKA